jgi:hypothetical protein
LLHGHDFPSGDRFKTEGHAQLASAGTEAA